MSGSGQESTHRTIERVARESYGRLVAYLSSHTRDVASAEDAFSNALVKALTTWPRDGVPQHPGLAADDGTPLAYRPCASSASNRSERAHSPATQGGEGGSDLVDGVSR